MDKTFTRDDWKVLLETAGRFWVKLTSEDMKRAEEGRSGLEDVLQSRYGLSAEEAGKEVDKFLGQQRRPGIFERLTEMNFGMHIADYVKNPPPHDG